MVVTYTCFNIACIKYLIYILNTSTITVKKLDNVWRHTFTDFYQRYTNEPESPGMRFEHVLKNYKHWHLYSKQNGYRRMHAHPLLLMQKNYFALSPRHIVSWLLLKTRYMNADIFLKPTYVSLGLWPLRELHALKLDGS